MYAWVPAFSFQHLHDWGIFIPWLITCTESIDGWSATLIGWNGKALHKELRVYTSSLALRHVVFAAIIGCNIKAKVKNTKTGLFASLRRHLVPCTLVLFNTKYISRRVNYQTILRSPNAKLFVLKTCKRTKFETFHKRSPKTDTHIREANKQTYLNACAISNNMSPS